MKTKKENKIIKYLNNLLGRSMIALIILLLLLIISKSNKHYKDIIISNIYEKNITFAQIKKLYNKCLGGITPLDKTINNVTPVFNESLAYNNISKYYDGVKLEVENNYLIPVITEGMIVFEGEKENYGNVIIIEGVDGISIWYGNIDKATAKLYDYVEKGTYLGTTKNNILYLAYQKDGQFLNYEDHLK